LDESPQQSTPSGSDPQSRVEKPWGHEIWWAQTDKYAGKLLVVNKGLRLSAGASWRNEPGVVHTIEALKDSTVLEVSTPQLDDVVRLSDRYGR
jgi:mannose-6-phosphate isomerase